MPPHDLAAQFPTFARIRRWIIEEGTICKRHLWTALLGAFLILAATASLLELARREYLLHEERERDGQILRLASAADAKLAILESSQQRFIFSRNATVLDQFQRRRTDFQHLLSSLIPLLPTRSEGRDQVRRIDVQFRRWLQHAALPEIAAAQQGREASGLLARSPTAGAVAALHAEFGKFIRENQAELEAVDARMNRLHLAQTLGWGLVGLASMLFLVYSNWGGYRTFRTRLGKVESALAQTHSMIATTLDGVLVIDDQGLVRSLNPAAEKMFAQSAQAVLGQHISQLIPQRLFFSDMMNVGRGTLMAVGQRQGYYPFPIEISLSEIIVDQRRQFCALIRDVTERKRGEETLKHIGLGVSAATGEEFVRSLLKQLSNALAHEHAFLLELAGPGLRPTGSLTVAARGELRATKPLDLENTVCAEVIAKGFRAYTSGARTRFPEDPLLEEYAAESFVGMPLADHRGVTIGVMGVLDRHPLGDTQIVESTLQIFAARAAAEIERKCSEEALAAEKERLAVTLRSIGDGCITLDNDGRVLMLNPVAERLTGWTQDAALNQPLGEVFHILNPTNRRRCQHALQRIVETGHSEGASGPTILVARDETERLVESNSAPIRDRTGGKQGVVIVLRDVTERQRVDDERQKAEKLESLGLVAGGIAHDFNNILTAILGNITLALAAQPEKQISERLHIAKKATGRAQELAGQLLTFAKGGAPIKQTTALGQLIQDTVGYTLRESRTQFRFLLPDDLWPVEADPGQIAQVINNLVVNADQAMPAGGTLRISAENLELAADSVGLRLKAGRWVRFSFQDEGTGIPEEFLGKIFDPYFTTRPKSSGMGLATAYSVVKNHSGVIGVDSQPSHGSTFTVCLPASHAELKPRANQAPEVAPVPTGTGRVLVLDDEEDICLLVTCALEPLGYQVTETQDALTAIAKYEESMREGRKFDLVISDLTIPGGMGGREAMQRLLHLDPEVLAIVSSGYANDPVMSRHEDFGFSGMIAKPYAIDDLGRKVAEVLAAPRRPRVIFHDFEARKTA